MKARKVASQETDEFKKDLKGRRRFLKIAVVGAGAAIGGMAISPQPAPAQTITDQYTDFQEASPTPGTPAADTARLYARDKAGVAELFYKNDAGVERDLSLLGGGGGAPADAQYIVTALHPDLTAEKLLGSDIIMSGPVASRPAASIAGRLYYATDEGVLYRDTASTWEKAAVRDYPDLDNRSHGDADHSLLYERQSNKGIASGYAGLGSGGLVPMGQLATGTPSGAKFIRDDGVLAIPPGGSASYYGQRAETYITSGDGSGSNPYNASAITSAIDALPSQGGIVFVKAGNWGQSGESRIGLGGVGQPGRGKSLIIRGEGAHLTNQWKNGATESSQVGTHIRIGFDIIANQCQASFENIQLSPHINAMNSTPTLKYIRDGGDATSSSELNKTLGGVFLRDIRFWRGHPAIWWTGDRLPLAESSTGASEVCQFWNILVERCAFIEGGQGIKADEGDSDTGNGNFWAVIRDCMFQHRSSVNARMFDIQYTNLSLMMTNVMFEDVCQAATDFAIYIVGSNGDGSIISEIFTGDGANAVKDAKFSFSIKGPIVRNFRFRKDVDITGHGDYHMGRAGGTGVINVTSAGTSGQGGIILRRMERMNLSTGTLNNPSNVIIHRQPYATDGTDDDFLGTTTLGASPATYTNNDAYVEEIQLVGGTITDVTRNGQSCGTNRVFTLVPGKSVVITYSAAPSVRRFRLS